jgi:hypothetical protein
MQTLSPRRLASLTLIIPILAIPSVVTALTAAPNCGTACAIHWYFPW